MGDSRSIGPSWAKVMTPMNQASPVSWYASTPRVMFCIQVPMFDARLPYQMRRKAGWE